MRTIRTLLPFCALPAAGTPAVAQSSPSPDGALDRTLVDEISGDIAFEHIRGVPRFHRPMGGGEGCRAVEQQDVAGDLGLARTAGIITIRTAASAPAAGRPRG